MDGHRDNTPPGGVSSPDGDEPGAFLARLLARAETRRGLDEALLARLGTALMHCTELHAMRQRKGPPRPIGHRTVKHVFLLADGTDAVLWEVEHNTGLDGRTRYQLYADRESAEEYVRERFGELPLLDLWPRLGTGAGTPEAAEDADSGLLDADADSDADLGGGFGPEPAEGFRAGFDEGFRSGSAAAPASEDDAGSDPEADAGSELGRLIADLFFTARRAEQQRGRRARRARREYEADNSVDHARRLLRRAENADRPGEPVRRMLRTAVGHQTTLVALRHDTVSGLFMEWSLYEHAFLLADGAELSLWELEHSNTPDGHPVCEVYPDESAARESVERHRAGS